MKILNLYAGIGGNRKLWKDCEVTSVENHPYIASVYQQIFPEDIVVVGDAHQYLLDHFKEFDFIWSSPPCPTHSRVSTGLAGWGIYRYPDMALYQEILFLKHFFTGKWVVENVIPYYDALITPTMDLDRHYFWSNFPIGKTQIRKRTGSVTDATKEELAALHGIYLPKHTKNQRKLLRNAVSPEIGEYVFRCQSNGDQRSLLD